MFFPHTSSGFSKWRYRGSFKVFSFSYGWSVNPQFFVIRSFGRAASWVGNRSWVTVVTFDTRWFKVTFSSPSWRSLNHFDGSLNHPKKVTKNCQVEIGFGYPFFGGKTELSEFLCRSGVEGAGGLIFQELTNLLQLELRRYAKDEGFCLLIQHKWRVQFSAQNWILILSLYSYLCLFLVTDSYWCFSRYVLLWHPSLELLKMLLNLNSNNQRIDPVKIVDSGAAECYYTSWSVIYPLFGSLHILPVLEIEMYVVKKNSFSDV